MLAVRVLVAPDSAGGTLDPTEMATAIADGWRRARPGDDVTTLPLADGGEGLLTAVDASGLATTEHQLEVVGADGLATVARWLLGEDGVAVIETAQACGLAMLDDAARDPRRTTTWGVGQLLDAARTAGAARLLVGLGGSATVDGGAGALSALGCRLGVADGSGLKIGGEDLPRVRSAAPAWLGDWSGIDVQLLADVTDPLLDAPSVYGPQKGADAATVRHLEEGLAAWRAVVERDLGAPGELADLPGTGAAGGLGYGLAAGIGARLVPGAATVAELVGLDTAIARADLVITGEGRLDDTSARGKVVSHVLQQAAAADVRVGLVVGQLAAGVDVARIGAVDAEQSGPDGPGDDPGAEVIAAAARLAARLG